MKKLNEGQFPHAKSQSCENKFHVPSYLCRTQNYPLLLLLIPTY